MTKPYNKGDRWFIRLDNGWEMESVSFKEAWEYYEIHKEN